MTFDTPSTPSLSLLKTRHDLSPSYTAKGDEIAPINLRGRFAGSWRAGSVRIDPRVTR
jgi:hypothetical protein